MKERVLEEVRRHAAHPLPLSHLCRRLGVVPKASGKVRQALDDLIREGKVVLDQRRCYAPRRETKAINGVIRLHPDGFGFVIPDEPGRADVFVPRTAINYAMHGDHVLAESFQNPRDGRFEGRVIQVLERVNKMMIGTVQSLGRFAGVEVRDGGIPLTVRIEAERLKGASVGDLVAVRLIQFPGPERAALGEVVHVIGDQLDEGSWTHAALVKRQIVREFPPEVRREIAHLPETVDGSVAARGRVDLRDLPIITIDGINAKDFDDAVCVRKMGKATVLYVSIADVSEYVPVGSALDQEAYRRGTSTYLPDECIPMLPEKLSNNLCSLVPHLPRLTLTAEIHYDAGGGFTRASFYRSVIQSHRRATYQDVQAFIDGTGGADFAPEVKKSIQLMHELSAKLMVRTRSRGALGFDLPEALVVYDAHGKIKTIQKSERFFSHKLIEEFMIAANVAVACYFGVHALPQLYRIHDAPDPHKLAEFMVTIKKFGLKAPQRDFNPGAFFRHIRGQKLEYYLQMVFLRSLKQAVYDAENHGHYGLALADYCHFTSPIRRYPDLIVHRQLKSLLALADNGVLHLHQQDLNHPKRPRHQPMYSFKDLGAIGRQCSRRERESTDAEREIIDLKRVFFMRGQLQRRFYGRVTRVTKYGVAVELEPFFVEGWLPTSDLKDDHYQYDDAKMCLKGRHRKHALAIGDFLWVRVRAVNIESRQILLAPSAASTTTSQTPQKPRGSATRHRPERRPRRRREGRQ